MSLVARCASTAAASTAAASTAAANEARRPPPRRPSVRRRDVLLATTTTTLLGTTAASEPSSVALASSAATDAATRGDRRPGPEFSDVAFPRYPGFVNLPSGVQIRDLCVGDGDGVRLASSSSSSSSSTDDDDARVAIEWGAWTVHQGRVVVPLLPSSPRVSPERLTFRLASRGEVIPAIRDAVAGMRVGGVRRVLVPPTASASYPYVPLRDAATGFSDAAASTPSSPAVTKYGRAPLYPTELGAQSMRAGEGPTPSDPAALAWTEYVLTKNAFTIKPTDRSMLFDVRLVSVGDTATRGGRSSASACSCRAATAEDQPGVVNERGEDGGASYWTAALPTGGDYVRHAEGVVRQFSDTHAEQMTE
jgi:hypothetical protein